MYPEPSNKHKAEDAGTRLSHYQELLELWRVGLAIYQGMNPEYINVKQMAQLEAGVAILEKQIDVLTGYDQKAWEMRKVIDSAHKDAENLIDKTPSV